MDLRVQLAVDVHVESRHRDRIPVADDVHPVPPARQTGGHGPVGPDLQRRVGVEGRQQPVRREVISMLVRDEDGGSALQRGRVREHPGIDHEPAIVLAEDHARVAVLDQLHDLHPGTGTVRSASVRPVRGSTPSGVGDRHQA